MSINTTKVSTPMTLTALLAMCLTLHGCASNAQPHAKKVPAYTIKSTQNNARKNFRLFENYITVYGIGRCHIELVGVKGKSYPMNSWGYKNKRSLPIKTVNRHFSGNELKSIPKKLILHERNVFYAKIIFPRDSEAYRYRSKAYKSDMIKSVPDGKGITLRPLRDFPYFNSIKNQLRRDCL